MFMVRITKEEIDLSVVYRTGFEKVRQDLTNLLKRTVLSDMDSVGSIINLLNVIKARRLEQINKLINSTDDMSMLTKLQKEQEVLNRFTPSDLRRRATSVNIKLDLRKFPEIKKLIDFYGL